MMGIISICGGGNILCGSVARERRWDVQPISGNVAVAKNVLMVLFRTLIRGISPVSIPHMAPPPLQPGGRGWTLTCVIA